jgi:hypothetical protein
MCFYARVDVYAEQANLQMMQRACRLVILSWLGQVRIYIKMSFQMRIIFQLLNTCC